MESSRSPRTVAVQHTPLWMLQEVDLMKLWDAHQPESINDQDLSHYYTGRQPHRGPDAEPSPRKTYNPRPMSDLEHSQSRKNKPDPLQSNQATASQSASARDQTGNDAARIHPSITSPKALLEMIKSLGVTENEKTMLLACLAVYKAQTGKDGSQPSSLQDQVDRCHDRIETSLKVLDRSAVAAQYNEFGNWVWGLFDDYLACNQSLPRALESRL